MDSFCFPATPCPTAKVCSVCYELSPTVLIFLFLTIFLFQPFLQPAVPDASLLINAPPPNSYQAWRHQHNHNNDSKKVTSILKKQVRFDSPTIPPYQQPELNCNSGLIGGNMAMPQYNTPPLNKVLRNKPFHEIYMANIPNRHLDLSLIDLSKPVNTNFEGIKHPGTTVSNQMEESVEVSTPTKKTPTTYKEFLEMQKNMKDTEKCNEKYEVNDCITDIFNYTSPRIEERRRQDLKMAKIEKFEKNKPSRNQIFNVEHQSQNITKNLLSPNLNNSYKNDATSKENKCYDNIETRRNQQILSSKNYCNALNFKQVCFLHKLYFFLFFRIVVGYADGK